MISLKKILIYLKYTKFNKVKFKKKKLQQQ